MLLWNLFWQAASTQLSVFWQLDSDKPPLHDEQVYISSILENIGVPGGLEGLAIASPSTHSPNYYFHWVRDGAITIDALVDYYNTSVDTELANKLEKVINSYLDSSAILQTKDSICGLGEPKFYIDGSPFNGEWGRPQNDGPALRAMVSSKWAVQQGSLAKHWDYIHEDLEYTSHHWALPGYDLWEELYGYHFFTSITQYGAMKVGAHVAGLLGYEDDSHKYASIAVQIAEFINSNFMPGKFDSYKYVSEHFPRNLGGRNGLDAGTVLAVLQLESLAGWTGQDLEFNLNMPAVKETIKQLVDDFTHRYPINGGVPGGIGRYPEDEYDGIDRNGGNPWFICTAAVAEALITFEDDRYKGLLAFIEAHRGSTLSEQMDARTGYMRGAANLTWSYTSVLRAYQRLNQSLTQS